MSRQALRIIALAILILLHGAFLPGRSASQQEIRARARVAVQAAAQVDPARMVATIRSLSTDTTGARASRYAERSETYGVHAPRIAALLGGSPLALLVPFESERTETTQVNVFRVFPSASTPSAGLVLVTAHYDATGRRTPGWSSLVDPAPGADDNASGVAVLVEAAQALDSLSLPFDVALVAFGSEEAFGGLGDVPLEGSRAFVRGLDEQGILVLGAINCDMVAYNPTNLKLDVVANPASEWLADLLVEARDLVSPGLTLVPILTNPPRNSDHASFWDRDEDAVNVIENKIPNEPDSLHPGNPFYHTTDDTLENLNFALAAEAARLVIGAVAGLGDAPSGPPDLLVDTHHIILLPKKVFLGDRVTIEVRVYNRGGLFAGGSGTALLEVWAGDPGAGGRLLGQESIDLPITPWFFKRAFFTWLVDEGDVGGTAIVARVSSSGLVEASVANNEARRDVAVFENVVSAVRPISNPLRLGNDFTGQRFEFQVPLHPGILQDVEATVFDIQGRCVARHAREGAQDGLNFLLWRNFHFESGEEELASGVYLIDVRLLDRATGAEVSSAAGKFVVMR